MPISRPFPAIPPELLAQMAAQAFRPPGAMNVPSLPPVQPAPRLNVDPAAVAHALIGLAKWRPDGEIRNAGPQGSGPGGAYTTADAMAMAGLAGSSAPQVSPSILDLLRAMTSRPTDGHS